MRESNIKVLFLATSLAFVTPLSAGKLTLPSAPLITESRVQPNVVFVVDDSGSMDWEIMAQPHYAACNYFNPSNYSGCSTSLNDTGLFYYSEPNRWNRRFYNRTTYYLYYQRNKYSSYRAIQFEDLLDTDWRVYDAEFNTIYYTPTVEYQPWAGPCSDRIDSNNLKYCENADFKSARVHPKDGNYDHRYSVDLDNHRYSYRRHVHSYVVSFDDKGYSGTRPTPTNMTNEANQQVDVWDSYAVFGFDSSSRMSVEYFETQSGYTAPKRIKNVTLSGNACYDVLGPKAYVQEVHEGGRDILATGSIGCRTIAQARQNYANWFEYYRRRAFTAKAGISLIMDLYPSFHYGLSYINDSYVKKRVPEENDDVIEHNLEILNDYFNDYQSRYGTPLVRALDTVGRYYKGDFSGDDPIKYECQLNNSIMLTDGYYNGSAPYRGDVDGDGYRNTLADIARYYYNNDLQPSMPNSVPTSKTNLNNKQHMNTYGVAFGVKGKLIEGNDGWPSPNLNHNSNWGNPTNCDSCSEKIDDLWHAAYNSHGRYSSVSNVNELLATLESALGQIAKLSKASLSTVSLSSTVLNADSHIYQGTFNTSDWSGELTAYPISERGVIDTTNPSFRASNKIANRNSNNRVIHTYNGTRGVPFKWVSRNYRPGRSLPDDELNNVQADYIFRYVKKFNRSIKSGDKISESQVIEYLRGNRNNEQANDGRLRTRKSILGDMVHSSPLYVGPPNFIYQGDSYLEFKEKHKNREPMIAVGANDGMMHLFSAKSGEELMAYVPGHAGLWSHLAYLSHPDYEHRFYVDGLVASTDVYFESDKAWHTLLVGSMRAGGQGIFALDITDATFSQSNSNANKVALFEFDDSDDEDFGYYYGKPHVVQMNNDQWAIIVGNGYNATSSRYTSGMRDSHVSSSKKAALFILFIEKGLDGEWKIDEDYIKILVGNESRNGLSEPFPVDIDGDYKVDYIFAGDLDGDVYKFNVKSDKPSDWGRSENISKFYQGNRVITTPLVVGPHPEGLGKGMMVYFGTGKYIEITDNANTDQPTQTFFGLWDKNDPEQGTIKTKNNLLQQKIIASNNSLRAVTNHEIDFSTHEGWYLNLEESGINNGERSIGEPKLRNGRIIFTTLIPGGSGDQGVCNPNLGTSWIMELDARDGSHLGIPPYDVSLDGQFTEADYITFIDPYTNREKSAPHGGVKSDAGMLGGTPAILTNNTNDTEYKVLSGSGGLTTKTESVDDRGTGRQSWQQVY